MLSNRKILSAGVVPLLVVLGAAGAAIGAAMENSNENTIRTGTVAAIEELMDEQVDFTSGPVQCEIRTFVQNGALVLENIVHSLEPADGIYRVKIASVGGPNRSSIQQGGYFSVDEHKEARVGTMVLGKQGSVYDVSLSLEVDGKTVECNERIGIS